MKSNWVITTLQATTLLYVDTDSNPISGAVVLDWIAKNPAPDLAQPHHCSNLDCYLLSIAYRGAPIQN
jgi:hypothetical protein